MKLQYGKGCLSDVPMKRNTTCFINFVIVIVLLSSYLYGDKRSCPWTLVNNDWDNCFNSYNHYHWVIGVNGVIGVIAVIGVILVIGVNGVIAVIAVNGVIGVNVVTQLVEDYFVQKALYSN